MFIKLLDLPVTLTKALTATGYAKVDVNVEAHETYSMRAGGSEGRKAFVVAVNLATGEITRRDGSWGGPNMFNPRNAVDLDDESRPLPPNFAVIHGSVGNGPVRVWAVHVNPATLNPMLPKTEALPKVEQAVLDLYAGLNSGGRKNQIEQWIRYAGQAANPKYKDFTAEKIAAGVCKKLIDEATDSLVARKFLSKNKVGAISVTTEGKNVRTKTMGGSIGGYGWWPGKADAPVEAAALLSNEALLEAAADGQTLGTCDED